MLPQVLSLLRPERGGTYVDGTLGGGGDTPAGIEQFGKLKKIAANSREIRKNRKPCGGFGES